MNMMRKLCLPTQFKLVTKYAYSPGLLLAFTVRIVEIFTLTFLSDADHNELVPLIAVTVLLKRLSLRNASRVSDGSLFSGSSCVSCSGSLEGAGCVFFTPGSLGSPGEPHLHLAHLGRLEMTCLPLACCLVRYVFFQTKARRRKSQTS